MSNNIQSISRRRWLFRLTLGLALGLLLLARLGHSQTLAVDAKQTILQGAIHVEPSKPLANDQSEKIQPGTPVKLAVTVENRGQQPSSAGQLFLRYAFAKPLHNEATSVIFETEKQPLPAIAPGQKIEIDFDSPHQLPSLLDFVRDDWSLREYQAVAVFGHEEKVIGTLAITFSAYYYPGIHKELSVKVPAHQGDE